MEKFSFDLANTAIQDLEPAIQKEPVSTESATVSLEQRVLRRLQLSSYKEMSYVRVNCEGDIVTLRGTLGSYFLKQLAQEIAKSVPDVSAVRNECHVLTHKSE